MVVVSMADDDEGVFLRNDERSSRPPAAPGAAVPLFAPPSVGVRFSTSISCLINLISLQRKIIVSENFVDFFFKVLITYEFSKIASLNCSSNWLMHIRERERLVVSENLVG